MKSFPALLILLACFVGFSAQTVDAADWVYPLDVASTGDSLVVSDRSWPGVWKFAGAEKSELFAASKKFRTPLNAVRCVAVGPAGQIYAGCSSTRQVYRIDEDGPKKLAGDKIGIGIPMDIAVAPDGTLYVSDIELHRIYKVSPEGGEPELVASVAAPRGVYWDEDALLVVSHGKDALLKVTPAGEVTPLVTGQAFDFPHEVARLGDTYFVTDGYADGIWPVSADGKVGGILVADGMTNPVGLTRHGDKLIAVDPRAKQFFALSVDESGKATIAPYQPGE